MRLRLLPLFLLALCALSVTAQKFNPDTRYRLVASGVGGALADNMFGYSPDPSYSTTTYALDDETASYGDGIWWRIVRTEGGWTFQNAATGRYLEFREYTYSYSWDGQTYSGSGQTVRTNPVALPDSACWLIDYQDGAFRINAASDPNWALAVYHRTGEYGDWAYLMPVSAGQAYEAYVTAFDIYAEDGTQVTGEGTPGYVLSALHISGKSPVPLDAAGNCLLTIPDALLGADYEARVTWDGTDGTTAYTLLVDGAEPTAEGFRITNVSCQEAYPYRILSGTEPMLSGTLRLTTLPIAEIRATGINGTDYVQGTFRLQDADYPGIDTTYTALVKVRGATAQRYDKKPYNVKLYEADGVTEQDANLLGLRNTHTWMLDAMYVDRIRMRNRVCFDTWNEIDSLPYNTNYNRRNGTVGRFVEVFVDGKYKGLYCLADKVNRKLLNLTKVEIDLLDETKVTPRGLLYKGKQWGDDTYLKAVASSTLPSTVTWGNWELEYPDEYPSAAAWTPLRNLINYGKTSDARFQENFEQNYYFDNLLNYALLQLAYNLEDNGMKNMYVSTKNIQKAGKRMVFTVWDMDSSLGGLWDGKRLDITADTTYLTRVHPLARLFSKNLLGFRDSLRLKWHDLSRTVLSQERLAQRLDTYADLFQRSGAWQREYALWGAACHLTEDPYEEVEYVKEWYARNTTYLNELLPDLPTGIERLQAVPNAAEGIYTIDGRRITDTRLQDLPHGIYIVGGRKVIR